MKNIQISFVGDIFPANLPYMIGWGVASSFKQHKGVKWDKYLNSILKNSDLVFGNLESPLTIDENYADHNCFYGHSSFILFLKKHKIHLVSIANNHILEQGIEGLNSTCEILKNNNIRYVGICEGGLSNIEVIRINDISIGFCGFNLINSTDNTEFNEDNIFHTIEKLKGIILDYRIVSLHWGNEYNHYPSFQQIKLAHKIIDEGVDIIIGHHPHVIQPVEEYRDGIIFYSLGNFIFDMLWSKKVRKGLVGEVVLNKSKKMEYELKGTKISNSCVPIEEDEVLKNVKKINDKFAKILCRINENPVGYTKKYRFFCFINRLGQRILMKIFLVKNFWKLSAQTKKYLFEKVKMKFL